MNIREIEALTEAQAKEMAKEVRVIKDHTCYFVDCGQYFEYSMLVFRNGHHIHYANDYKLHHNGKSEEELTEIYVAKANRILFTDAELAEEIKTYDEYSRKGYFVRNYWIMQFDYVSMFHIGEPTKEILKAEKEWDKCFVCMAYVPDVSITKKANALLTHIEHSFRALKGNEDTFREMIRYELANHEACITMDPYDALKSLGLSWNKLEDWQKRIVKAELDRCIEMYA